MVWTKLNQSQYYMMASDRAALNKYTFDFAYCTRPFGAGASSRFTSANITIHCAHRPALYIVGSCVHSARIFKQLQLGGHTTFVAHLKSICYVWRNRARVDAPRTIPRREK